MSRKPDSDQPEAPGRFHTDRGRLGRLMRLGSTVTSMAADMLGQKMRERLMPKGRVESSRLKAFARSGSRLAETLGELKGAAMKVGQLLSITTDILPKEISHALTVLQKDAPPMSFEMVAEQIEKAFDLPIHEVYLYFEPTPIAAASIGQVHKATLFTGETVAVKVQYPGITDTLDSDLKNLSTILNMARVVIDRERLDAYMDEVREMLHQEADYTLESANIDLFREILGDRPGVRIPVTYPEHTRHTVLTMEYIPGVKLDAHLNKLEDRDERNRLAMRFTQLFVEMFHELGMLHADPHPGNFLVNDRSILTI